MQCRVSACIPRVVVDRYASHYIKSYEPLATFAPTPAPTSTATSTANSTSIAASKAKLKNQDGTKTAKQLYHKMITALSISKGFALDSPVGASLLQTPRYLFLPIDQAETVVKTGRLFSAEQSLKTGDTILSSPQVVTAKLLFMWKLLQKTEADMVDPTLHDWRILDIGSGTGWGTLLIAGLRLLNPQLQRRS